MLSDDCSCKCGFENVSVLPGAGYEMKGAFSLDERIEYLQAYGRHTMAYSTLQPGMEYFDLPNIGFLGYKRYGSTDFVLAHPISAEEDREQLLEAFLREHPGACFVQVYEPVATLLRDNFGYFSIQMGIETWLDGRNWNLNGGDKAHLRRWINTAKNANLTVKEVETKESLWERPALEREWLQSRINTAKLRFLVRDDYTEPKSRRLSRLFGAYQDSKLMGLVEFDPIFEKKVLIGYYADIVQFRDDAPNGTCDLIIATAFSIFFNEGVGKLSLGLAPLAKLRRCQSEPPLLRGFLSFLYRRTTFLYNFQGVYFHKEKYRGEEIPVFYATKHRNAFPGVMKLFRLVGVI